MIYVVDTDMLTLLARQEAPEAPRIRRRILELPEGDSVVTTVITCEEQMRGWMSALSKAKSAKAEAQVYSRLLDHISSYRRLIVLGFDEEAAVRVRQWRSQRLRVGTMDLRIAAVVLGAGANSGNSEQTRFRIGSGRYDSGLVG